MRLVQVANTAPVGSVTEGGSSRDTAMGRFLDGCGATRLVIMDDRFTSHKASRLLRPARLVSELRRLKPEIVVLNKADAIPKAALAKKRAALRKACGHDVFVMSGVTGEGVEEVLRALAKEIAKRRAKEKTARATAREWAP